MLVKGAAAGIATTIDVYMVYVFFVWNVYVLEFKPSSCWQSV